MSVEVAPISVGNLKANLPVLSSQSQYRTWAQTWQVVLMGCNYWRVITDHDYNKESRPSNAGKGVIGNAKNIPTNEQEEYDMKNNAAHAAILSGVSTDLQRIVAGFVGQPESARLAWKALKDKFNHETPISTLELFKSLVTLEMKEGDIISNHISNFETTYAHIFNRCSESSREEAHYLKCFLDSDSIKTMTFLYTLPRSFENVVDNLMSKERLTFADVNKRLLDIQASRSASSSSDSKAYFVDNKDSLTREDKKKGKECSWCKARNKKYKGHLHSECRQLKIFQEKERNTKGKEKAHTATTTENTESSSFQELDFSAEKAFVSRPLYSSHPWILDSGATAHMTPFREDFSSLSPKHGSVSSVSVIDE